MAQRLASLAGLGRAAVPVAAVAGAASSRAPSQHPAPQQPQAELELRDDENGFVHIGQAQVAAAAAAPVAQGEVRHVLTSLAVAGGVALEEPASPPRLAPRFEELGADEESDASSEGWEANRLMASADSLAPQFGAAAGAVMEPPSTFDLLTDIVTNLVNDPQIMEAVTRRLASDPAFIQLADRYDGAPFDPLPAPARVILLEELRSGDLDGDERPAGRGGPNPLVNLLQGIQRGVAAAAVHIGEAVCHLGNMIRGLGETLGEALAGVGAAEGGEPHSRSTQRAIMKVACVVAVLVVTRRVAVPRAAMAF